MHQSGLGRGRMADVSQTRPCWSIIGLCGLAGSFQISSSPKKRDGAGIERAIIGATVAGSARSGTGRLVASCVTGSSIVSSSFEMLTP